MMQENDIFPGDFVRIVPPGVVLTDRSGRTRIFLGGDLLLCIGCRLADVNVEFTFLSTLFSGIFSKSVKRHTEISHYISHFFEKIEQ